MIGAGVHSLQSQSVENGRRVVSLDESVAAVNYGWISDQTVTVAVIAGQPVVSGRTELADLMLFEQDDQLR